MNTQENARHTYARRFEMVQQMTLKRLSVSEATRTHGVTAPTVRKSFGRYLAGGERALCDA